PATAGVSVFQRHFLDELPRRRQTPGSSSSASDDRRGPAERLVPGDDIEELRRDDALPPPSKLADQLGLAIVEVPARALHGAQPAGMLGSLRFRTGPEEAHEQVLPHQCSKQALP